MVTNKYGPTTQWGLQETPSLFDDMGTLIVEKTTCKAKWVNSPACMPVEISDKIIHSYTVVKFGKNPMPEATPQGVPGKLLQISKENINFTSVRYQHGFEFNYERFQLPEGKEDFIVFSEKLSDIFEMRMNYSAVVEIVRPKSEMMISNTIYNSGMNLMLRDKLIREVDEFGEANQNETGFQNRIWRVSNEMKYQNDGQLPNIAVMDGKKQGLIKFGNKLMYDYQRAGPDGVDRLMTQGMIGKLSDTLSVYELPVYSEDTYEGRDHALLTQDVSIANVFVAENDYLGVPPETFQSDVHRSLLIHSEPDDGPVKIKFADMIENCGRWDVDGNLIGSMDGDNLPPFMRGDAFYTNTDMNPVPCATFAELEDKYQSRLDDWYDAVGRKLQYEMDKFKTAEERADVFNELLGLTTADGLLTADVIRAIVIPDAEKVAVNALLKDVYPRLEKHGELREVIQEFVQSKNVAQFKDNLTALKDSIKRARMSWMREFIGKIKINKKNFLRLAKANVQLPIRFVIFRPYMAYRMSNVVLIIGGAGFGKTKVGHAHASCDWVGKTGHGEVQFSMWISAKVYDEKRRSVLQNVFYDEVKGGAGRTFYSIQEWEGVYQSMWTSENLRRSDLLCTMELIGGRKVNHEYCHLGGRCDFDHPEDLHYESADFCGWRYHFNELPSRQQQYANVRSVPQVNPIAFQGSQWASNQAGTAYDVYTKNRGHHKEEFAGVLDMRRSGTIIKQARIQ